MGVEILLDLAVSIRPDDLAIGRRGAADGLSFAALDEVSRAGASVLRQSGRRHVAFVGVNGPAFSVALFSAARAGLPITPLNYRLADAQLRDLIGALDDPLVLADDDVIARLGEPDDRVLSTSAFLGRAGGSSGPGGDAEPTEVAAVLFTSGTTSAPKGVVLKHDHLVSYVLQTVEMAAAEPDECALVSVPPYHIAGLATVLTNAYAGRRVVHLPDFSPAAWLGLVRSEGVTSAMVVPTMLARIVEHLGDAPADTPTLRSLSYGGARLPQRVLERALAAFPATGFSNAYGLTETSSTIALLGPDDHRAALSSHSAQVRSRLTSAGRAVPGIELEIRLPGGGSAPTGVAGDLHVRGAQVSGEYVGLGSVLDDAGWFATRDRAWLDTDGYLFIEGRTDDTIIRGGENIAPAEVEDALLAHEAVLDAAVVGLPDEEWGEQIVAVVVVDEGAEISGADLRTWARSRLRGSKTPTSIEIWDALPYSQTGKLLRREVVSLLQGLPVEPPATVVEHSARG